MSTATATDQQRIKVVIAKDGMSASVLVRKPTGDETTTAQQILDELTAAGVIEGIDHQRIQLVIDQEEFGVPVKVAEGVAPSRGESSQFDFVYRERHDHRPTQDEDGRIDYREMNFIKNTEAGQVLVLKTPPTMGESGITVLGKVLPGLPGRDVPLNPGANTEITEDGLSLVATAGGVVQETMGKVSVKNLITIASDVDHTTGNIDCRGSCRIKGTIRAGYTVTVDGDLEVSGSVEDAVVTVGGSALISGGFYGKGDGILKAEGDIAVKFAEGQKIVAGGSVIAGHELIGCQVTAKDRVVVRARGGKIVGGDVRAGNIVRASVVGSNTGTRTQIGIAVDPSVIKRMQEIEREEERLGEDDARVKEALIELFKLEVDNQLPPEKRDVMRQLKSFRESIPEALQELQIERKELQEKLDEIRKSRVLVEQTVYAGTRAIFGVVYREIDQDLQACRLSLEGNQILVSELTKSDTGDA